VLGSLPHRRREDRPHRFRRGVFLLPSLFTVANLFCGYACVIFALRHAFEQAAMFIGFAIVLDMLDGRVARMTGTSSAFGVEFDSLADVVSFGMAPAVLCFAWGLKGFDQAGWAAHMAQLAGHFLVDAEGKVAWTQIEVVQPGGRVPGRGDILGVA